ncbi:MAG: hypothetical protein JWO12_3186 [Frankiales bacterium]|nr:hypothetical protein [Frankiales bacterium]
MARKAAALLLAALVLLVGTPSAGAGAADTCPPGLGIGLLQIPRAGLADPRAHSAVVDVVKPGATFSRDFQVCNGYAKPLSVQLYPDSALISGGAFALQPGHGTNELTSWMSVSPTSLVVPPGKAVKATLRFAVPIDATAGERYGGVIADAPPPPSSGVVVGARVGIRVYLEVSRGGAPKSDFNVDSLQAVRNADGTPAVLAKVHNTGARALDMRGSLQLSNGPGGLSAGPFPAQLGTTLAPRDTADVVVPLDKAIRGGPWHAVIDMKSGLLERKASGEITFPDKPSSVSPPVKAKALALYKDRSVLVPVAAGMVSLLLLVLLVVWFLARRRIGSRS